MAEDYKLNQSEAPFNAAIDCLMRISKIIQDIRKISVEYTLYTDIAGVRLVAGQAQHIKKRLVKQLYVQAIPLLSEGGRTDIYESIKKVKLAVHKPINAKSGKSYMPVEIFDEGIDELLDDIVIEISKDLQDKGKFFMPPRMDPRRAMIRGH